MYGVGWFGSKAPLNCFDVQFPAANSVVHVKGQYGEPSTILWLAHYLVLHGIISKL